MKKIIQHFKRVVAHSKTWAGIGLIVLTAFTTTGVNWIQNEHDAKQLIGSIVISMTILWWLWTLVIVCKLINHQAKEAKIINHFINQIQELRKEIKNHFFK